MEAGREGESEQTEHLCFILNCMVRLHGSFWLFFQANLPKRKLSQVMPWEKSCQETAFPLCSPSFSHSPQFFVFLPCRSTISFIICLFQALLFITLAFAPSALYFLPFFLPNMNVHWTRKWGVLLILWAFLSACRINRNTCWSTFPIFCLMHTHIITISLMLVLLFFREQLLNTYTIIV